MTVQGLLTYGALCSNELWNAERIATYIKAGIRPDRFDFRCDGCPGLTDLLPCIDPNTPPDEMIDYVLPEVDTAPWYDSAVPESKNFAGLYVLDVTMSAPYSRVSTANIGDGATLGRLKRNGRTITVRGVLVGKTCCATEYGLRWLTSALDNASCSRGDCDGCDFDYLACCPVDPQTEDGCLTTVGEDGKRHTFMRSGPTDELVRAEDFWRRLKNVGVVSGPEVLACIGASCGCGCASLTEVTFTLFAASPYIYHIADVVANKSPLKPCSDDCTVVWMTKPQAAAAGIDCSTGCFTTAVDCLEDPNCPTPPLPPEPVGATSPCGCDSVESVVACFSAAPQRIWGDSTLNIEIYSGANAMRNVDIFVHQNPKGLPCADYAQDTCDTCLAFRVTYIPPGSTFHFSGEERTVTLTCGASERSAASSLTNIGGGAFDWPDIACAPVCLCVAYQCSTTADDATITVERVDRDL